MRTKTTKEAEIMAFERLPDIMIVRGALSTLYKRHKAVIDLSLAWMVAVAGWAWGFYQVIT